MTMLPMLCPTLQHSRHCQPMTIKRSKIRESAHLEDCSLRINGPGNCSSIETTVLAHAPCIDKGMGIKGPDTWAAYACHHCHDIVDGRAGSQSLTREDAAFYWLQGIYETQKKLRQKGLIK